MSSANVAGIISCDWGISDVKIFIYAMIVKSGQRWGRV
jgi:hypothetical protein